MAIVTLNRPDAYNAIDSSLSNDLVEAVERAGRESRALVITGAGKAFCSGADLRDLLDDYREGAPDLAKVIDERFTPIATALARAGVPTVAAINGPAVGAGLGMALACDGRVLSTEAYLMSAFINVALIPDTGTSWYLTRMVGLGRAIEIATSGRRLGAEEALELGLVHQTAEPEDVELEAVSWAGRLANGPIGAYVATRRLLQAASSVSLDEALELERDAQRDLGERPEHREGVEAFIEKRSPDFRSV